MQNPLKILYPDQCVACGGLVDGAGALCTTCWAETPFIDGLVCDSCGVPLLGDAAGARPLCDDCIAEPRAWVQGRAVMAYRDAGRRMVLGLKHADRLDLVRPMASWMAARGGVLNAKNALVVPVPMHWSRLLARRFNQSALLAREVAREWGQTAVPDALIRTRRTRPQERMTKAERHNNQAGAIRVNPARGAQLFDRSVVLVDDVMTSGATLTEATQALNEAGARTVRVLVLARVVKDT
ncbi:MAG: ComF family protein [Pseudomonadota bacterium]